MKSLNNFFVQGADIVEKLNEIGKLREMLREFKVNPINPFAFNLFLKSVPPTYGHILVSHVEATSFFLVHIVKEARSPVLETPLDLLS